MQPINQKHAHLTRRHTPHLEVIVHHKLLSDPLSKVAQDPFFEILRLDRRSRRPVLSGINEALDGLDLEVNGESRDVVLIRV